MHNQFSTLVSPTKDLLLKQFCKNLNFFQTIISNLEKRWTLFKRALYKARRILYSIPIVKSIADRVYETKVARYKASLPPLNAEDQKILEALETTGTFAIPIEDLQLESTPSFLSKIAYLVEEIQQVSSQDKLSIDLEPHKLKDYPEIFLWGIEQRFLNIIEHCIGLPIYYQGYSLRRDIVTQVSKPNSVRKWHLDAEDRTVVKIIVYLNDVGIDGGHYEYIPKDLTPEVAKKLNYHLGYIDDQTMLDVIPKESWSKCLGKKGTVVITNTSNIFHRAKPPEKEDRFSISFCYTSNKPMLNWDSQISFPHNLPQIRHELSEKQRKALINKNNFLGIKLSSLY